MSAYLDKKVEEAGGARDSLDDKIYRTVREQAGKLGLTYEADAPAYWRNVRDIIRAPLKNRVYSCRSGLARECGT